MAVLTPQQRATLESSVKQARKFAEIGAFNALHGLAVDHPEPFTHMSPAQRGLRNSLRSKARLLGDILPADGAQRINHLMYELAYETWHKMLFAKFLEANGLLMHPHGVAVSMDDCEEFAKEEGFLDKWDTAAAYASKMLPAIFRTDDPLMQVAYATDERIKLEGIIGALENQVFTADDALGWVYQFWQSEAKAAINASGDPIDGAKLPAVTQLFTEPYMVHFLIDNTLGAWWVSRNPGVKPPVKFEYLRLTPSPQGEGAGGEVPAAGKFEGWPDKTAEVTSLDPCMGSGHFVASLFPVFASLRMYEEGLTKEEATDKVITENLHGLELDARCTQIAAFNLALTAWKFCGHYKVLPEMNLACSGIAPKGKKEDWVKLVGKVSDQVEKARLENGMEVLFDHFQLAPELGSLLDPTTIKADAFTASFDQLQPVLKKALESEADTEQLERGVMASGIAKAGQLLAKKYTLHITNVPYLAIGKQDDIIAKYCKKKFLISKNDIATVFFEKFCKDSTDGSSIALVIPQNWLFQSTYKKFRRFLLGKISINVLSILGGGSFSQISGEVVKPVLIVVSKLIGNQSFYYSDISECSGTLSKESELKVGQFSIGHQSDFLNNFENRFFLETPHKNKLLSVYADSGLFVKTGDDGRRKRYLWEILFPAKDWLYCQTTVKSDIEYGGRNFIIDWREKGNGFLAVSINKSFGLNGIAVSQMSDLSATIFTGELNDSNICPILPKEKDNLIPIWCYCSSLQYKNSLKEIDKSIKITNATLVKVPFDLEYWQKVASEKYPNGLPKPYTDDSTQWLYHGHPVKTDNPLLVALARVLGYRWPAESDTEMELSDEARELIQSVKAFDHFTDEDGIFCIPSVNAEQAGAERLREYLQQVFEGDWNNQTITQLLQKEGASSANLEAWLRDEFFSQHCKVFQNRPFIWHIWDGRKDGFSALVNYHKLTKENLVKLTFTYLGDWIRMCDAKKKSGESGAEGLYAAAIKLKEKLESILTGESPYDIFVRWKPLEQQPIGWEPDLNDGVRLNIRPFIEAGILRNKFNVKWGIDRGKNPPNSPWGEIRDNDKHLSLEAKQESRAKKM